MTLEGLRKMSALVARICVIAAIFAIVLLIALGLWVDNKFLISIVVIVIFSLGWVMGFCHSIVRDCDRRLRGKPGG
jgi:hypothetical protein